MKNWHLEKLSMFSTLFALLCCLGFGPLIAFVSAIGAGFLVDDAILKPLLIFSLLAGALGLWMSRKKHGRWYPLGIHLASAATIYFSTYVRYVPLAIWMGVGGLFLAVVADFILAKRTMEYAS